MCQQDNKLMISIIAPVYQVEAYLPACVESILAQTYENWELILVDDGSKDNSGSLCDAYAAKDCRIRVHHQTAASVLREMRDWIWPVVHTLHLWIPMI